MITAHLPAGYILGQRLDRPERWVFAAALLGAVFPGFDFLFYVFVDHGRIHHHRYWVHIPFFWAILGAVALPLVWRTGARWPALAFLAAVFLHLLLDTLVGDIMWGAPVSTRLMSFFDVPPTYDFWLWSFIFHWSFLVEIAIWLAALLLWRRART